MHCNSAGILLAFTIPRVPSFQFNNDTPLTPASGSFNSSIPTQFSRLPANFSFGAFAALQINTGGNFIPLTFSRITAEVYDLDTNFQVATGDIRHQTFPAKAFPQFNMPLNFSYVATNDTDQTCRFCSLFSVRSFSLCIVQGWTGMRHARAKVSILVAPVRVCAVQISLATDGLQFCYRRQLPPPT